MDFLDILLEAKGDKKTPTTKLKVAAPKTTDYNAEEEEDEEVDAPEEETEDTTEEEDEETGTDYTETEEESDPEEDGADEEDLDEDGEGESTDYTSEEDDTGGEDDTDETGEEGTEGEETTEEAPEEDPEEAKNENENNRVLLEDFSNLYYTIDNTIAKLDNIDKSNIMINKIVTQITTNLNRLNKQLFDFITFSFSKGKYVTNLYKYNYFLEGFRINVKMLKKIGIFIPN